MEGQRGSQAARRGLWVLCILALTTTGVATLGAALAAGYTYRGDRPFSTAGALAQLGFAVAGLALATGALTFLTLERHRRAFLFASLAIIAAVAWWPVMIAFWDW